MRYHEAIVVGGGLAGLRAAIALNQRNVKVGVLSKVHPLRSHSIAAQGGINGSLGNHPRGIDDSWEKHAFDTIKGSDYLADQDAVEVMVKDAPQRIREMEHWGTPFSRNEEGKIAQRPFGGAGFPRTCYGVDLTGHILLHTLYEQCVRYKEAAEREEIVFYNEWVVISLVVEDGAARGVIAFDMKEGKLEAFMADALIFCTGGVGRIYRNSTNALINSGFGMAIPFWAGVPLKDMEFIQFHPTCLYGNNILITEGARGEGGYLLNNKGERFLADYPDSKKLMELAPRDIVSRNMTKEIEKGNGIEGSYLHLDLKRLGARKITERLPGIRDISIKFAGIDPIDAPIPVVPSQHYSMGGIDCNSRGETIFEGLYAAGEGACVSVHGANRLGGNSLLETIVFGAIAGTNAANFIKEKQKTSLGEKAIKENLKKEEKIITRFLSLKGKEKFFQIKEELGTLMTEKVGIFREEKDLGEALAQIKRLSERFPKLGSSYKGSSFNYELLNILELKGSLDLAEVIVSGAIARKESRGSHFRKDYPQRDDKGYLKHTIAHFSAQDEPKLSYKDVAIGSFLPKERSY